MTDTVTPFAEARARRALALTGLEPHVALTRADSVTNEVFLSSEHVIRVNRKPTGRLHREAALCESLPERPWAPRVVAHGYEVGLDYLVARRRPGATLARWWPMMTRAQRRDAVEQLAAALGELHQIACPADLTDLHTNPQLLDLRAPLPLLGIFGALDRLRTRRGIDAGLLRACEELLVATGDAVVDRQPHGLVHGDLSFENVLWDGSELTGLLDFEWSRTAPADLDLDVLLRFCAHPGAHLPSRRQDELCAADLEELPGWLRAAYPALFAHPRLLDRLRIYDLGFNVRELVLCRPFATKAALPPLHPHRRLRQLLDGLSHLDDLHDRGLV
jgi:Ser/Thr protein kinase RdoA (MazF antagonist)